MFKTLTLNGRIADGLDAAFEGPVDVFLEGHAVSVHRNGARGWSLRVVPFHGHMFLDTPSSLGSVEAALGAYRLSLSGPRIGAYARGGGPDGDFDVFSLEKAEIRGAFDQAGLAVSIVASTLPASSVCWSTRERQDGIHEPIEVTVEFRVPPHQLEEFTGRRVPVDAIARFGWPRVRDREESPSDPS